MKYIQHLILSAKYLYAFLRIQGEGAEAGATANFNLHFIEGILGKIFFSTANIGVGWGGGCKMRNLSQSC